jgi:ABC-type sugar transport systems, permease components
MELFRRNRTFILLGSLPALVLYVLFVIYPIFRSFVYGFYEWNGLSEPTYVGLKNFQEILHDPVFWNSFRNNLLIVGVSIFGQIPIGLVLAVMLSRKFPGSGTYRSIFFIPMVLSTVVVALLWSSLLNPQVGVVNQFLKQIGLGVLAMNWLGDMRTAMAVVCGVIIWQFSGLYMVIFLAAIQNIPKEIYEACSLDGVSERAKVATCYIAFALAHRNGIGGALYCREYAFLRSGVRNDRRRGQPMLRSSWATYMYNKTFAVYKYG